MRLKTVLTVPDVLPERALEPVQIPFELRRRARQIGRCEKVERRRVEHELSKATAVSDCSQGSRHCAVHVRNRRRHGVDPIRQGRDIDLDPLAGIGLALTVQRLMQQELLTSTIVSRLGPAKPRGIGWEGAGASVIASQSRHENFSRTCSIIFQRRGSHSRVFDTTSPSLCSRSLPHATRAGAPVRRYVRPADCPAADLGAAGDCARACLWRLLVLRSRPWFPVRPGSLRGPRKISALQAPCALESSPSGTRTSTRPRSVPTVAHGDRLWKSGASVNTHRKSRWSFTRIDVSFWCCQTSERGFRAETSGGLFVFASL